MITDTFLSNSSSSHFYKNMHSEVSLIGQHTQSHVGINLLSLSLMNIIMKHFRTSRPCVFIFLLLCFGGWLTLISIMYLGICVCVCGGGVQRPASVLNARFDSINTCRWQTSITFSSEKQQRLLLSNNHWFFFLPFFDGQSLSSFIKKVFMYLFFACRPTQYDTWL